MNNKSSVIKFKCENCGASLKSDDKLCAYCGSVNKNYQTKNIEEVGEDKKPSKLADFDDVVGGFLGGLALNEVVKGIGNLFDKK